MKNYNGIITTLLMWQYHEYDNSIWCFKWICDKILNHNPKFHSYCKFYVSIFGLYLFVFGYPVCLLLILSLNCLFFLIFGKKTYKQKEKCVQTYASINNKLTVEMTSINHD